MAENIASLHHPIMAANDIRIPMEGAAYGESPNIAGPHASSSSNSNAHTQPQAMTTNDIRISVEEATFGQSRNIACSDTSSPCNSTNTNTSIQSQALSEDLINLSKTSVDPNCFSIFKVPNRLRQVHEEAYEPRAVSIGPYHHGKEHLRVMQDVKESCLRTIIAERTDRAGEFVSAMKKMEGDVRKCYGEGLGLIDSNAFVKMMIVDGCFIVQVLQNPDQIPYFVVVKGSSCDIICDFLVLENQLPFSVVSKLYGIINNKSNDELSDEFACLALSALEGMLPSPVIRPKKFSGNIRHLLGLVHGCWISHHIGDEDEDTSSKFIRCATELEEAGNKLDLKDMMPGPAIFLEKFSRNIRQLLGLVHGCWISHHKRGQGEDEDTSSKFIRRATELEEAGIKFEKKGKDGEVSLLFDIEFTDDATLKIPALVIDDCTERFLRNFMAYEQFTPIWEPTCVCDFVLFMDNLIDSSKDVQLLRHSGVIDNCLGDDDAVAQMFNRLGHFICLIHRSLYCKIYYEVNDHCQRRRNVWKAKLNKDYFNSPWSLISVIAAIVLLLLTMVQTIFSVLSYHHP